MSSDWSGLVDVCALTLGAAIRGVPGADDTATLERVLMRCQQTGSDFLEAGVTLEVRFTPAIWAGYLGQLCSQWQSMDIAPLLQPLHAALQYTAESDEDPDAKAAPVTILVDATIAMLTSLVRFRDAEPDDEAKRAFLGELLDMVRQLDAGGYPDQAYDLAAAGLDLGPEHGVTVERLARFAIANGAKAGRMHQVAVSEASLAVAIAAAAENEPERRIEAFDASERAIEALAVADPKVRPLVVAQLNPLFETWGYLQCLQLPLLSYLPAEERSAEFNEQFGSDSWPARFEKAANVETWLTEVLQGPASAWETEIDANRFRLEAETNGREPGADWAGRPAGPTASRQAVPQDQSFFREVDFPEQLLELTHEVTRTFCYFSQVGKALTALRIALFDNEITLWSNTPAEGSQAGWIARLGAAPIAAGNVVGLIRAELRLELVEKARLLQDVWTAWFEGLAVFAESAADPRLDTDGASLVGEAIRSLVDFFPEGSLSLDELHRGAERYFAEFEGQWHEAIREQGAARLARHIRADDGAPVLGGYLAIQSVIASWEQTLGRRMLAAEALGLLLHATRHGTETAVPDLSMPAAEFGDDASRLHALWIKAIASLSGSEIQDFLQPPETDGPGRAFVWEGERLSVYSGDDDALIASEISVRSALLEQAFRSSIGGSPEVDDSHEAARAVTTEASRVLEDGQKRKLDEGIVRERLPLMDQFLAAGGLLPIGSSAARFHLRTADGEENSQLSLYLRTTEKLASTGEPGGDMLLWRLAPDKAIELENEYRQALSPRLKVSRLIDIAGLVRPGSHGSCHVFALNYGSWMHLQGTAPATEMSLREDDERRDRLTEIIRYRLAPSPLQQAERELIAPGRLPVERTLAWLKDSDHWAFGQTPVDANSWAAGLKRRCEAILGFDHRDRQRLFAIALLGDIWADREAAEAVGNGFAALTDGSPETRSGMLDWLYRIGRGDEAVAVSGELESVLDRGGLPFVTRVADQWAIRPIVPDAPETA